MEEGVKEIMSKFTEPVLKRIMPQMFNIAAAKDPVKFEKMIAKHGVKRRKVNPRRLSLGISQS